MYDVDGITHVSIGAKGDIAYRGDTGSTLRLSLSLSPPLPIVSSVSSIKPADIGGLG